MLPVVAETFAAGGQRSLIGGGALKADQEQVKEFARRRSNEVGAINGMYVLICQEPPLVQVTLGDQ